MPTFLKKLTNMAEQKIGYWCWKKNKINSSFRKNIPNFFSQPFIKLSLKNYSSYILNEKKARIISFGFENKILIGLVFVHLGLQFIDWFSITSDSFLFFIPRNLIFLHTRLNFLLIFTLVTWSVFPSWLTSSKIDFFRLLLQVFNPICVSQGLSSLSLLMNLSLMPNYD